jgi:hypothetical protein
MINNRIEDFYNPACDYDQGGIQRLFICNYGDSGAYTLSDLKTINSWGSIFNELKIDTDLTKIDIDYDTESRRYIYKLNIIINEFSDGWNLCRKLENGRFIFSFQDGKGEYWICGLDTGFRVEPSSSSFNLYNTGRSININMRESSRRPIYKINKNLVEPPKQKGLTLDDWPEGVFMSTWSLYE